jgi:hypothetical protein
MQLNEKVKSATTGALLRELVTGEVTSNALVDQSLNLVVKGWNFAFAVIEEISLIKR